MDITKKDFKIKVTMMLIIVTLVSFGVGVGIGADQAIDRCVSLGLRLVDHLGLADTMNQVTSNSFNSSDPAEVKRSFGKIEAKLNE